MSEQPTTEPVEPSNVETPQGDPAELGDAGKKALAAEREARKAAEKSAAEFAARLKEIEQANLSELEKAQRAAKEAQDRLSEVSRQNARNSVALAKGIPPRLVGFLAGDSEEEIAANAEALLEAIAEANAPTTPRPDPTQGAKGGEPYALNSDGLEQALRDKLGI